MNTSATPPASICRASTELAANDNFTATPVEVSHCGASSPSTSVNDAAAKTSNSGFFGAAEAGASTAASIATHGAKRKHRDGKLTSAPEAVATRPGHLRALFVRVFVALDLRVRRMIVDRFEVLRRHDVRGHAPLVVEPHRDVAHHVFDELRVVVGAFG